jgi:hypothetical protein
VICSLELSKRGSNLELKNAYFAKCLMALVLTTFHRPSVPMMKTY